MFGGLWNRNRSNRNGRYSDEQFVNTVEYSYDEAGKLMTSVRKDAGGICTGKTEFEYDENNNAILVNGYNEDGTIGYRHTYKNEYFSMEVEKSE